MFDTAEELATIRREVAHADGGATVAVRLTRTYDADADDVWEALTDPDRLRRWFSPVSGDLAVGGTFQVEGNAGGEIRRCDRPTTFEVTFGSPDSVVRVSLDDADHRTALELLHTMPLAIAGSGAGALFVGPGWDGALLALALHLRGVAVSDPLEAASSPQVLEFNGGSVVRWTQAVESSGTATAEELAEARATAVAQYTPQAS